MASQLSWTASIGLVRLLLSLHVRFNVLWTRLIGLTPSHQQNTPSRPIHRGNWEVVLWAKKDASLADSGATGWLFRARRSTIGKAFCLQGYLGSPIGHPHLPWRCFVHRASRQTARLDESHRSTYRRRQGPHADGQRILPQHIAFQRPRGIVLSLFSISIDCSSESKLIFPVFGDSCTREMLPCLLARRVSMYSGWWWIVLNAESCLAFNVGKCRIHWGKWGATCNGFRCWNGPTFWVQCAVPSKPCKLLPWYRAMVQNCRSNSRHSIRPKYSGHISRRSSLVSCARSRSSKHFGVRKVNHVDNRFLDSLWEFWSKTSDWGGNVENREKNFEGIMDTLAFIITVTHRNMKLK